MAVQAPQDGNPLETARAQSRPLRSAGVSESSRCLLRCHEGEKSPRSAGLRTCTGLPYAVTTTLEPALRTARCPCPPHILSQPFSLHRSARGQSPPGSRRSPGPSRLRGGRGHGTGGTRRTRRLAPAALGAELCTFCQSAAMRGRGFSL